MDGYGNFLYSDVLKHINHKLPQLSIPNYSVLVFCTNTLIKSCLIRQFFVDLYVLVVYANISFDSIWSKIISSRYVYVTRQFSAHNTAL